MSGADGVAPTERPDGRLRVCVVSDDAGLRPALSYALTGDTVVATHAALGGLLSHPHGSVDLVVLSLEEDEDIVADAIVQVRTHIRGPVIVVLDDDREPALLTPLAAGARGVVMRSSGFGVISQAVAAVQEGGVFIDPAIGAVLIDLLILTAPSVTRTELTAAELRVLTRIPQGMTNTDIAADMGISVNTVKTHMRRILAKLDSDDRVQAVQAARARGLLP